MHKTRKKWKKPHKLGVATPWNMGHYSVTMKGYGLIIFAVLATLAGAVTAVFLIGANETISTQAATITKHEVKIEGLKSEKATLETNKADLTQKLDTTTTTLRTTETKLSELTTQHYKKIAEHAELMEQVAEKLSAQDKEISALNTKLSTAQNKNRDYDSKIKDLNSLMADKDRAIDDIGRRLESAEEDRDHLMMERKKLIAEKAELEKQFQDILVLRQKVQELQVELTASRKLEWLRRGFYGGARKKGGSRLMGMSKKSQSKTVSPNADLNVEVRRDGTVKIVPIQTNLPPNGVTP